MHVNQLLVTVEGWQRLFPVSVDKVGTYFRHADPDVKAAVGYFWYHLILSLLSLSSHFFFPLLLNVKICMDSGLAEVLALSAGNVMGRSTVVTG